MNVKSDDVVHSKCVAFVIFGVTGDLTKRKLMPALYELKSNGYLSEDIHIIGFARRNWSSKTLKENVKEGVGKFTRSGKIDNELLDDLLQSAHYIQSSFFEENGYGELKEYLLEKGYQRVVYYLATPPEAYVEIIRILGISGLATLPTDWIRIVIEKPYGRDIQSADELEDVVHQVFQEDQVYRIDHYLGKETVQNIHVLRFANGIFEPLWNRRYVDHVQITVAESVGVGSRSGYYETAGVIRDMFQNHLLQLVSLTAMEAPVGLNADAVRDEKVKVLRALRPIQGTDAIYDTFRAQYVSGYFEGERVKGYKDEEGVSSNSITETFLAMRLFVDNWRWAGVPFYIRSGKRMPCRVTEIAIQFKQVPLSLFNWHNMAGDAPNMLVLNLQPNEGILLTFGVKQPGPVNQIAPADLKFSYEDKFGVAPPEAYERLLLDCFLGDATLFTRSDEVKAQWTFTTNILNAWENSPIRNLPVYEAGTWGPPGADDFIGKDRRTWHEPCPD